MSRTTRCDDASWTGLPAADPSDAPAEGLGCQRSGVLLLALSTSVLLLALSAPRPAASQVCSWGGTPSLPPPEVESLRSVAGSLDAPSRVAAAGAELVYTTDPATGRVLVTDPHGGVTAVHPGLGVPYAIAADSAGAVYLGEQTSGRVTRYDEAWEEMGSLGQGAGEFVIPTDIAIDPDPGFGRVYVTDGGTHQLRVYGSDGSQILTVGGHGAAPGLFDFPSAVWVSTAGEVFVADQNNDRVQVFDRGGTFLRCFGNPGDGDRKFGRIQGLTGDSLGRLYVADVYQGQVRVFDPQGVELSSVGSFGERPGQLRTPSGVTIDANNRLFVASVNTGRVEVFGLDDFVDPPAGPEIFSDGFESGDTHAWTATNP